MKKTNVFNPKCYFQFFYIPKMTLFIESATYKDAVIELKHTREEWKLFRDHDSDIYNKDFDYIRQFCKEHGSEYDAPFVRREIEWAIIKQFGELWQDGDFENYVSLMTEDEKLYYCYSHFNSIKHNPTYAGYAITYLERKNENMRDKYYADHGRVMYYKQQCKDLIAENKQLKTQLALRSWRNGSDNMPKAGHVCTEPNYAISWKY